MVKKSFSQKVRVKNSIASKKKTFLFKEKTVKEHLRIYFWGIFVATFVFAIGSFVWKEQPPCANSLTCMSDLSIHIDNATFGMFEGKKVLPPKISIRQANRYSTVLGTSTSSGEKHIYVDLSAQTLYAYQGTTKVMQTLIASGKWGPTPVGNFHIWEKLLSTRMAGGEGADAYDLPNVPYVMYFYSDFGLHGAYWHDNFGHPMSHGCVNMRQVDAAALYAWADGPSGDRLGTAVSICNQFIMPNKCIQNNPIN